MKTMITVQHAQSEHHVNGMVGSQTDWPLTAYGKRQARQIAQTLALKLKGQTVKLYASDQARVKEGAEYLAEALQTEVIYDQRLREQSLGDAIGKSVKWLRAHIIDNSQTADSQLVKNAETLRDVYKRVKPFYEMIERSNDSTIIIYSHGALLSVFNLMHLNMQETAMNTVLLHGKAGSVSQMRILDDGKHTLDFFNDLSFVTLDE